MKLTNTELKSLIASRLPNNTDGLITPTVLRGMLNDMSDSVGTHAVIDPHDYGAKGDAVSLLRAVISVDKTQVTDSQYTFKAADVGKTVWIDTGWQTNGETRTIASINAGAAVFNTPSSVSGTRTVLFGTDDTLAIEAAFEAAATVMLDVKQLGTGADAVSWGGIPVGGNVRLRSAGYIVKNTQARYDAGKIAAIMVPRHCGLEGEGMGQTAIYVAPGNVGHGIANAGAGLVALAGDEKITMRGFSLYCMRGLQGAQALDGIYFATSMGNYTNVDAFSKLSDIQVYQARRHGFFIKGRGECIFDSLWAMNCENAGYMIDGIQDSRFNLCNAGGNGWCGFYVEASASSCFSNCKSFYNGASGGTDRAKCANWFISDDQHSYRKGSTIYVGCESQESRGSGWYIIGGLCQFSGCLSSDPKRFGGAPWPDICAGVHIDGNGSNNVFDGFYIRAALGLDWGSTTEQHYGGDYALYIGQNAYWGVDSRGGPRNNKGNIYTLEPSRYDVAKLGGLGTTNTANAGLYVDGDPLPGAFPATPAITAGVYVSNTIATINFNAPATTGGRNVRDYIVEYRLAADSAWTRIFDAVSTSNTAVQVTGLTDSEAYKFRVAAVTAVGQGPWSAEFDYTHNPTVPYQVGAVTKIMGNAKAYLSWAAPVDGGRAITDYLVEYKLTSEPTTWTTFADGTSTTASATVTGLTNDSSYDFRVSAINEIGTGPVSATVTDTPRLIMDKIFDTQLLQHNDFRVAASIVAANGTAIETWQDISGRVMNLTQTTAGSKPSKAVQQVNSIDAVSFDGVDDRLNFNSAMVTDLPTGDFTMFFAFKLDAARLAQTNALLDTNNNSFLVYLRGDINDITCKCGNGSGATLPWVADALPHVLMVRRIGAAIKLYLDGVNTGATNETVASNPSPTSMWLGQVNQFYGWLDGCYAITSFYNDDLSNTRCNEIGSDLHTAIGSASWTNVTS